VHPPTILRQWGRRRPPSSGFEFSSFTCHAETLIYPCRELQTQAAAEAKAMAVSPEVDLHNLSVADALRVLKGVLARHARARKATKKGIYPYKFVPFVYVGETIYLCPAGTSRSSRGAGRTVWAGSRVFGRRSKSSLPTLALSLSRSWRGVFASQSREKHARLVTAPQWNFMHA
jgi:hypothetical protein